MLIYWTILACVVGIIYLERIGRSHLNSQYQSLIEAQKRRIKEQEAHIRKLEALLYSGDDE